MDIVNEVQIPSEDLMVWRVATGTMLKEILNNNPSVWQMAMPIQIFGNLLHQTASRAAELNDPKLNALMCQLALYAVADPSQKEFDITVVNRVITKGYAKTDKKPETTTQKILRAAKEQEDYLLKLRERLVKLNKSLEESRDFQHNRAKLLSTLEIMTTCGMNIDEFRWIYNC